MKKVGIMSMQRIVNYGSFLQSYGLKKIIEAMGENEVQFVDYTYESPLNIDSEKRLACLKRKLSPNYLPGKIFTQKCAVQLKKDLKTIGVDKPNFHANVDTLVIGSDEVFNCLQGYPVGYSRELFGKNYEDKKVISYAASFGYTTLSALKKYDIESEVRVLLSKFAAISVRDHNAREVIKSLTGRNALLHFDPVLIYDFDQELKWDTNKQESYIVVYAYTNRLNSEEEKYIKAFARKHNKKIYSIGNYSRIADKNIICNPLEVFSYFKGADFVITDTFHGTIFSVKTNSRFCTIIRESNKNKLIALLQLLDREDRIVNSMEDIESLYMIDIDFRHTNEILEYEKMRTIEYLKENL